eukprot:CAMPEP_0181100938 /NCGR_PEP_ID=MMETSP1071-20121207/13472_1 /TAXON_ID=35127 /ORGANISM="Thalassiosira sp., Strain NH16" /LENGTH=527 /DNA_ID=CAMNT_0023183725 /DNA_START=22 /DNA_END=1605 /DNA_ORIENTATION=+
MISPVAHRISATVTVKSPATSWASTSLLLSLLLECFAFNLVGAFRSPSSVAHIVRSSVAKKHDFVCRWSSPTPAEVEDTTGGSYLDEKQLEFCKAYLNEHHKTDVLLPFTHSFSELGTKSVKKNMWIGGSYSIVDAEVTDITSAAIHIEATVEEGGTSKKEQVVVPLDSDPVSGMARTYPTLPQIDPLKLNHASKKPIDNFCRRMSRLCNIVKAYKATGKLIQMGVQLGGDGVGKLHDDMYLNQVPHNRYVRQYFYDMASNAALEAATLCSKKQFPNRMKMTVMFPEMNPQMDSYRIGTLLELSRSMAIKLAEQNLRVRVCVQGSMGVGIFTGVPKQLNGVHTLLQRMDWQSGPGEENEGMVGDFVNFGFVGKEHVVNFNRGEGDTPDTQQDDVFIIICPQNMVGLESSIIKALSEMVDAAGDRPVIILNPDLTDKTSSEGQQSVRGRQQRLDFANSFETIYQFQNIYVSGTSYFPILGSVVKLGPLEPWVAHQRRDLVNDGGEVYLPMYSSETQPESEVLMATFEK